MIQDRILRQDKTQYAEEVREIHIYEILERLSSFLCPNWLYFSISCDFDSCFEFRTGKDSK